MQQETPLDQNPEIIAAAQALGDALRETPEMQAFLQAQAAFENDAEVRQLEEDVNRLYQELSTRQQAGEVLSPQEINQFYRLRDELRRHPIVVAREETLKAMKVVFEQAGSALSTVLTVNFSSLALPTDF